MLFIKDIRSSFTLCQKPRGLTTYLLFFIIADTTRDLFIMHACDTFCDQLILLYNYVISIRCNYFTLPAVINIQIRSFHEIRTGTKF